MTGNTNTATDFRNTILNGDSVQLMRALPRNAVDFILTDPPYLVNYQGRDGRKVRNDDNARWLRPAFNQMHRVLKWGGFAVSFYGWNKIDLFAEAWKAAGFRKVGHIVFRKSYASSSGFLRYEHESAYLLAKGNVKRSGQPVPDVIDMPYSGNKLHPTQKPVAALLPLVDAFCSPGGLVLDPFCGSGSSLVAAQHLGRDWLGMELDTEHAATATRRLWVVADKGYASDAFRERIWDMGDRPAIPAKRRDASVTCPKWAYRCRHLVENLWARLKEWRAVATRYEKTATSFLAVIHIAAAADWIKP